MTQQKLELLEKIFCYGAYTSPLMIETYLNCSRRYANILLEEYVAEGYLKQLDFYINRKNTAVYQITFKTAKRFNNPHTNYRKKHSETYIIRSLIRSHFLFEMKELEDSIVWNFESRNELMTAFAKGNTEILPVMDGRVQVDEFLINTTNNHKIISTIAPELYFDIKGESCIILHIDKVGASVYPQMMTVIERYKSLMEQSPENIHILFVTDKHDRAGQYRKCLESHLNKQTGEIPTDFFNLHYNKLLEGINSKSLLNGLDKKILNKYSKGKVTIGDIISPHEIDIDIIKSEIDRISFADYANTSEYSLKVGECFSDVYRLALKGQLKPKNRFGIYVINSTYNL